MRLRLRRTAFSIANATNNFNFRRLISQNAQKIPEKPGSFVQNREQKEIRPKLFTALKKRSILISRGEGKIKNLNLKTTNKIL